MTEMIAGPAADARRNLRTFGQELGAQERREAARTYYRESVEAEMPVAAEALGRTFGRSTRWGRDRIAEVRAEEDRQELPPDGMPPPGAAAEQAEQATPEVDPAGEDRPGGMPAEDHPSPPAAGGMPAIEPADTVADPSTLVDLGGMPRRRPRRPLRSWPVLLLALPAFVAIWGGWVGLGEMTGFGEINLLPGMVPSGGWATINSAITLPIGVEAYAAFALRAWLSSPLGSRSRRFAKWSAVGSLALGFCGQVAYHQLVAAGVTVAPWWITTLVSGLPIAVLGMGTALAHLLHSDRDGGEQ